jgi:hypothetical protein
MNLVVLLVTAKATNTMEAMDTMVKVVAAAGQLWTQQRSHDE